MRCTRLAVSHGALPGAARGAGCQGGWLSSHGLVCVWAGDVLMLKAAPLDSFLGGLVAFLAAHLAYIPVRPAPHSI